MILAGIKQRKEVHGSQSSQQISPHLRIEQGLDRACAHALAREGIDLVLVARTAETLSHTAAEIRKETGVTVIEIRRHHHTPRPRASA